MRFFAAILFAGLVATGVAMAADAGSPAELGPADQGAIRQVIQDQMRAFRRDDGNAAFGYASPGIQALFGNAAHFMDMVRQAYQPVYRPRSVTFGALTQESGRLVQRVEVIGSDGSAATALYFMQREQDGSWRIDGCELLQAPGVTT
jgi:hypothetical protein